MIRHSVPLSLPAAASISNLYSETPTVLSLALSTSSADESLGCCMKADGQKKRDLPSLGMYFVDVTRSRSFKKLRQTRQHLIRHNAAKAQASRSMKGYVQPRKLFQSNLPPPQNLPHSWIPPQRDDILPTRVQNLLWFIFCLQASCPGTRWSPGVETRYTPSQDAFPVRVGSCWADEHFLIMKRA